MTIFSLTEPELRERRSMKWRTYPVDVLPLWVAEMDVAVLPEVRAAIDFALDVGDTGYPSGDSYSDAFSELAAKRWGWQIEPRQIRRGGDVMNSIVCVLEGTTDPGDGIAINPPVYPPFWQVSSGYRRHTVEIPLTTQGRLDLAATERVFTEQRPRAYLLASPHNPNGTVHTAEELTAVMALCNSHDVQLIVDEIHACLVDPGTTFVPALTVPGSERAIVITSAGKAWNLAGFKAGLYIMGPEAVGVYNKLPPLFSQSTGHLGAIAHTAALVHGQDWVDRASAEIAEHKLLLSDLLHALVPSTQYRPAAGTYLAWVDCSALGLGDPARTFLDEGRVAFSAGVHFGQDYKQWVRINLAASPELITHAVERMAVALRNQPPNN